MIIYVCMYKYMYRKATVLSASNYSLKNLHLKIRIAKMIKWSPGDIHLI